MKDLFKGLGIVVFVVLFVYGSYWVVKKGSYFFFYEGFVQETIKEMVKEDSLKQN